MSSSSSARSSGAQVRVGLAQAGDGRLDGRQRRAQVVRGRAHERAAPAVDLLEQACPQGLLAQLGPVDGQRGLVGERPEQAAVAVRQPTSWRTSMPTGRSLTTSATETWRGPVIADAARSDASGRRPRSTSPTSSAIRWPALAATASRSPGTAVFVRHPRAAPAAVQRGSKTSCTVSTMCVSSCDSVRSPIRACDSSYRRRTPPSAAAPPRGRSAAAPRLGDDQDDRDVDDEGDPVLRPTGRSACRRAGGRTSRRRGIRPAAPTTPAQKPPITTPMTCRQHEHQRRDGDAQVGPEGEQHGQQRAQRGQRSTAIPTAVRWYVPLVSSLLCRHTCVTTFRPSALPSSELYRRT